MSELLTENARREALESVDDLGNASGRIGFDEQVNVVGQDFKSVDRHAEFSRLLGKQLPHRLSTSPVRTGRRYFAHQMTWYLRQKTAPVFLA